MGFGNYDWGLGLRNEIGIGYRNWGLGIGIGDWGLRLGMGIRVGG